MNFQKNNLNLLLFSTEQWRRDRGWRDDDDGDVDDDDVGGGEDDGRRSGGGGGDDKASCSSGCSCSESSCLYAEATEIPRPATGRN